MDAGVDVRSPEGLPHCSATGPQFRGSRRSPCPRNPKIWLRFGQKTWLRPAPSPAQSKSIVVYNSQHYLCVQNGALEELGSQMGNRIYPRQTWISISTNLDIDRNKKVPGYAAGAIRQNHFANSRCAMFS